MTTFIRRLRLRRVRIFIMKAAGTVCRCGLGMRTTGGMHRRRAFIGIIRRRAVIIAKKAEAAVIRDALVAVPSVSTAVRPIGSRDCSRLLFDGGPQDAERPSENLFAWFSDGLLLLLLLFFRTVCMSPASKWYRRCPSTAGKTARLACCGAWISVPSCR